MAATGRLTAPGGRNAWELGTVRWDVYYVVVFLVILALAEASPLPAVSRIAVTAALALMAPWYVAVGRPGMLRADPGWRAPVYLAGVIIAFAVAQSQVPNVWLLALAICPQCFHLLPFRQAMVPVVILNVLAGLLLLRQHPHPEAAVAAVGSAAFGIAFSAVYGGFVDRIIGQSLERAALISQLEVTRAELAEANRESGKLAERQRLAGEIHDTLAQGFSSIIMLLQAAEAGLADVAPASVRRQVSLAGQTARENLAEARRLVAALGPADLAGGNLPGALSRVAERTGSEAGVDVRFRVSGAPRPLSAALDVVLLRVGQEALSNVRKHAGATAVDVRLCYQPGTVLLEVADDGEGFDPALADRGFGLRGMRERVRQAGGEVEVRSAPGSGACVRVRVPA